MSTLRDWSNAKYPWDYAKCHRCMTQHLDHKASFAVCDHPDHEAMRDVVTEQALGGFYEARIRDAQVYTNDLGAPSPLTDKWLTDNYEKCVAIRELFRDHYANNPTPKD